MAMQVGGSGSGPKADINVTPLVDVMLVLLIIMMIVAPLLQQGVALTLPIANNSAEKPETQEDTVVAITSDGRFHVNGKAVQEGDLRRAVEEALEQKKQRILIIRADEDAAYSSVMQAMDELRAAGLEDIGLITERRTQGQGGGGGQ
jgi:biopolymer transport protein TolR